MVTNLVKSDDIIEVAPDWAVELKQFLNTPVSEPANKGLTVVNERRTFRVTDVLDANGRPMEFQVSIQVHRSPADADEAERLDAWKTEQLTKRQGRLATEQNTRDNEIRRACEITESALTRGMQVAAAQSIADKVRDSLALASQLSQFIGGQKKLSE